jgi:O-antigen ligase
MTFALYLIMLVLVLIKPVEAFAPELGEYRIAMVVSLLVFGLALGQALRTGEMAIRGRHMLLLAGLTVSVAMSQVAQGWVGGASEALGDFMPSVLLFLSTVMVVTSMSRLKATCGLIVLCMLALSIAGIAAYHYGFMVESLVIREGSVTDMRDFLAVVQGGVVPADDASGASLWRVRSWGFLSDPNDLAQAIVMALAMLFGAMVDRRTLRNLVCIWLPAAILLYAVWLTRSRGGMLALGVMLAYTMLKRTGPIRAGIAVAGFAMAAIVTGSTGGRGYSASEASAGGRIDAWSEGLTMLSNHPVFGVGYGNFNEHHDYTAHNSFVLAFAELGLVGYLFWLALLVLAFRELACARRISLPGSDEARWARVMQLALVGFLVCALFLSRSFVPTLYLLLGLCYACWHLAVKAQAQALPQEDEDGAMEEGGGHGGAVEAPVRWLGATLAALPVSILVLYAVVRVQNMAAG